MKQFLICATCLLGLAAANAVIEANHLWLVVIAVLVCLALALGGPTIDWYLESRNARGGTEPVDLPRRAAPSSSDGPGVHGRDTSWRMASSPTARRRP
jgi:hypothetical protein